MTKNLDVKPAEEVIGLIVNAIYNYVLDEKSQLDIYRKGFIRNR